MKSLHFFHSLIDYLCKLVRIGYCMRLIFCVWTCITDTGLMYLDMYCRHWIAVFGDVWPRHVHSTVNEMLSPSSFSSFTMNAKLLSSSIHETVG